MMEASRVYFADMRVETGSSLLKKLQRLLKAAGIDTIDFDRKFTAIKMHFGEPGNLAFLRPNFAKVVADTVREKGGIPFLTDCNVLYVGRRTHAIDHLAVAEENGFSSASCHCPVIIADGLKGTDEALVPLSGTTYVKEAKIGRALMDADIVISLTHFKGHEATGFGGTLKNLGMGGGSRAGKMEQHCSGKPVVDAALCRGCGACARACGQERAIRFDAAHKAGIDHDFCVGCGRCIGACNFHAVSNPNNAALDELCMKVAEYAKAVVQNRPCFHISIVMQVSPFCDCYAGNDAAIIPDVGMFASFDPVALDAACADACNRQPVLPQSLLADALAGHEDHHDHFTNVSPETNWRLTLEHAERIGIGTQQYELITVK